MYYMGIILILLLFLVKVTACNKFKAMMLMTVNSD